MLGKMVSENGSVFIKGRSVKNKVSEPVFIKVGLSKEKYMKTLLKSYRIMGYKDFDIEDLCLMSLKQWKRKEYPIPEGYVHKYSRSFNPKKLQEQNWNFRKKTVWDMIKT